MRIKDASKRFDTTPVYDAYTGKRLSGKCQMTVWDYPRRDGSTTVRRTLSVADEFELPPRRAVVVGRKAWIVGSFEHPDTFGGDIVRKGYVTQLADLGKIGTARDFLSTTAVDAYMSRIWVKDVKDVSTTSEAQSQYGIYFTHGEPVQEGEFLQVNGRLHIVRNIYDAASGFRLAEVNELESDCIAAVTVTAQGSWDPVDEVYSDTTQVDIPVIVLKWNDDYVYEMPSHEKFQAGDVRVRALNETAPTQGGQVMYKGSNYTVVSRTQRSNNVLSIVLRPV